MNRREFLKNSLIVSAILPVALYELGKMPVESNTQTLARWHSTLNGWRWPDDTPGKPEDFDSLPNVICKKDVPTGPGFIDRQARSKFTVIDPMVNSIRTLIGDKECLRWHHLHNLNRTNAQFELWWAGRQLV